MRSRQYFRRAALMIALAAAGTAWSATWTYPGCPNVDDEKDFAYDTLVIRGKTPDATILEPVKLAVTKDPAGDIEVYFAERNGKLKVFRSKTRTVDVIREFPVYTTNEDGLLGVTVDPNFAVNRYMYFMYSVIDKDLWRISRMTLSADRKSLADEKTVLEWLVQKKDCCHTGGGMAFDDVGDLWVTIGNNEGRGSDGVNDTNKIASGEWGASSTASLRGGVIRIHPKPDGTYSIPKGNFWEYFADQFDQAGKPDIAKSYRDSSKVKREIFIKGNRNPYTIALDPARRWVGFGDVGPDGTKPDSTGLGEEYNLHLVPAFDGWPYFAGNNRPNAGGKNADAPMNTSVWNTGVQTLPPATKPLTEEHNSASIAGPIYRYNKALASPGKLPPHFHRMWFMNNWSTGQMRVLKLGDDGKMAAGWTAPKTLMTKHSWAGVVEVKEGPDAALYVIHYAGFFSATAETRIERISYKGAACTADIAWEKGGCKALDATVTNNIPESCPEGTGMVRDHGAKRGAILRTAITLDGMQRIAVPEGIHRVELYGLDGKRAFAAAIGTGTSAGNTGGVFSLELPSGLAHGIYKVVMFP